MFKADDYETDGTHSLNTYAIRFNTEEDAKEYRGAQCYARSKNAVIKGVDANLTADESGLVEAYKTKYLDESENHLPVKEAKEEEDELAEKSA